MQIVNTTRLLLVACASYTIVEASAANLLGLRTLRHGTGPIGWVGTQLHGPRIDLGGAWWGESNYTEYEGNKNKFFVWNDRFGNQGLVNHPSWLIRGAFNFRPAAPLMRRLAPYYYAVQGSAATVRNDRLPAPVNYPLQFLGGIAGLMMPHIRIYLSSEDVEAKFKTDPNLVPAALYTEEKLSFWTVGMRGVIAQGVNGKIFSRWQEDPTKPLIGLTQLSLLSWALIVKFQNYSRHAQTVVNHAHHFLSAKAIQHSAIAAGCAAYLSA